MLTAKENFLETIKKDGHPDRLVNEYEAVKIVFDPIFVYMNGKREPGMAPFTSPFGVTYVWPEGQPAAIPDHTKIALEDVTEWKETLSFPNIAQFEDSPMWGMVDAQMKEVNREEQLATAFFNTGVFEQLHALMGFEDTLANFLMEPEAMMDLCNAIGEYRLQYLDMLICKWHPDAILSHDDWGASRSMFMSPAVWNEFLRPQYEKLFARAHEAGVIVIHHADSYLYPIVNDMADIGIDVWQGILPENDIAAVLNKLNGSMCVMGGLSAAAVDRADCTEAEIRTEVRRVCESYGRKGHFIPCITYGDPFGTLNPKADEYIHDEIRRYNKENYGI